MKMKFKKNRVYLKAKGQDCYNSGSCYDVNVAESTQFNINNNLDPRIVSSNAEGVSSFANTYETNEGKFAGVEFELLPKQINTIKVYQEITAPFEYYLDSLSTFTKAEHEKITIYGDVNVEFNDKYPVKKVSENDFVWEYSNIDVTDSNLKDKLIITSKNGNTPNPKPNNFYWIIGCIVLAIFILIFVVFIVKKKK